MTKHIIATAITTVALATVGACNKEARDEARNVPPAEQTPITGDAPVADRQDVNSPITVTGCLQKESGLLTTYIVTAVNEPAQKGAGSSGNGAAVEREQVREAAHAYRVEPKDKVDMEAMLGKEVRVVGVLTKRADLPAAPSSTGQTGTAGQDQTPKMETIDKGDLAKIEDATIAIVSDSCGGRADSRGTTKRGVKN